MLRDSAAQAIIQCVHEVIREEADRMTMGRIIVKFVNGTKECEFDLIVRADQAWSKVRPLLTDTKPFCSEISDAELWWATV